MVTGAVIVAAGLSSRMGDFKPMMKIGSQSVVQHVITAFRQAGVSHIVVVTGHCAAQLEAHLEDAGICFLHNEHYRTTQMFDSAKIGLSYLKASCDTVLFTPVDVPLFSARTVQMLLESGAELAGPLCNGRQGHPLMLSASVIDAILKDSGEGGLKGAVSRLNTPMTHVEVDDPGVLYDADTPEEFQTLLSLHSAAICPSDLGIEQILTEACTPEHVRAHCNAVAEKAEVLAAQIDRPVDLRLLRAACLLHDLARSSHKDHAVAAAEVLKEKGYWALADVIRQHHDLSETASVEAQLLYLADKLIQGTREVSVWERFSTSKVKCTTPEALAVWERRYQDALQIIASLQLDLDVEPKGGTV